MGTDNCADHQLWSFSILVSTFCETLNWKLTHFLTKNNQFLEFFFQKPEMCSLRGGCEILLISRGSIENPRSKFICKNSAILSTESWLVSWNSLWFEVEISLHQWFRFDREEKVFLTCTFLFSISKLWGPAPHHLTYILVRKGKEPHDDAEINLSCIFYIHFTNIW